MQIKCGTDIIEIARVQESIQSTNEKFLERVYTQTEIEYCESKHQMKYQHYAVRFAAKEAVFKAISNLIPNKYDITWQNIEVYEDKQGRPMIRFLDIELPQLKQIDVSLSHCKEYAVANVVAMIE